MFVVNDSITILIMSSTVHLLLLLPCIRKISSTVLSKKVSIAGCSQFRGVQDSCMSVQNCSTCGENMILDLFRKEVEFENIHGYDDIKDLVRRALDAYNLLFIAPPASAKTLFQLGILES